jgi:hypothetical protein
MLAWCFVPKFYYELPITSLRLMAMRLNIGTAPGNFLFPIKERNFSWLTSVQVPDCRFPTKPQTPRINHSLKY